jgi:hypothetical protein
MKAFAVASAEEALEVPQGGQQRLETIAALAASTPPSRSDVVCSFKNSKLVILRIGTALTRAGMS